MTSVYWDGKAEMGVLSGQWARFSPHSVLKARPELQLYVFLSFREPFFLLGFPKPVVKGKKYVKKL